MRRLSLAAASLCLGPLAEAQESIVAEFRLGERAIVATAWRAGEAVFVEAATLDALGLMHPPGPAPYRLQDIPGAQVRFDEAEAAVVIACAAACFPATALDAGSPSARVAPPRQSGLSLNAETALTHQSGRAQASSLFDLAVFGPWGLLEHQWVSGARHVRLDTRLTIDDPGRRTRFILGDAVTRGGFGGAPVRFTGLQWGVDFALDPTFVTFPAPRLAGEAAAPSVIDLYIDGARRYRAQTEGGPFSIEDAPVTAGAGMAQVVVTDLLGRAQTIAAPFYASASMLRPGLADFSFEAGFARLGYGAESFGYGEAFAGASYRRGVTPWLTAGVRGELGQGHAGAGAGLSLTHARLGQFDATTAFSVRDGRGGGYASLGWTRESERLAFAAAIERADPAFVPHGFDRAPARHGARLSASWRDERIGAIGVTYAARTRGLDDARAITAHYAPPHTPFGDIALTATWAGEDAVLVGLTLTRPLRGGGARTLTAQHDGRRLEVSAQALRAAPSAGGLGYELALASRERLDAAVSGAARFGEGRVEISRAGKETGVRGRLNFALSLVGGAWHVSQPTRGAFAVVDAGAPHVGVWHDGRYLGRTDGRGRILAPNLRAYDLNRLSVSVDELPPDAAVAAEDVAVTPRARAGALVRLPIEIGASVAVRVVDETGAPLPRGAVLTRADDGARFPVGDDGRVHLIVGPDGAVLTRAGCTVQARPEALAAGVLVCAAP